MKHTPTRPRAHLALADENAVQEGAVRRQVLNHSEFGEVEALRAPTSAARRHRHTTTTTDNTPHQDDDARDLAVAVAEDGIADHQVAARGAPDEARLALNVWPAEVSNTAQQCEQGGTKQRQPLQGGKLAREETPTMREA